MLGWLRRFFRPRPPLPAAVIAAEVGGHAGAGTPAVGVPMSLTEVLREQVDQLGGPLVELDRDQWITLAERIIELAVAVPAPSFPRVATQIVAMTREPDLDINRLVGLAQRDAAIASALLRTANSVAYAPQVSISSLRGAVSHLGMQTVVEVALGASARAYYEVASKAELALFPSLWSTMFEDSMANAFTCGRLALDIPGARGERALLAGLLADVGRPIALRILARLILAGEATPAEAVVLATLDEVAMRIGETAIRKMELPEELLWACIPGHGHPTADSMIARLVSSIAAIQRRSPRMWTNATDVRAAAEHLNLAPLVVRSMFAQRQQYSLHAATMFGAGGGAKHPAKVTAIVPPLQQAPR